jgi:hypothetical protein
MKFLPAAILIIAMCVCLNGFADPVPVKVVRSNVGIVQPLGPNAVPGVTLPTYLELDYYNVTSMARGAFPKAMFTFSLTDVSQVSMTSDLLVNLEKNVPGVSLANTAISQATGCDYVRDIMFVKGWRGPMGTALLADSAYSYALVMGDDAAVTDQNGATSLVPTFWITKLVPPATTADYWSAQNMTQFYISLDELGAASQPILSGAPDTAVVQSTLRDA